MSLSVLNVPIDLQKLSGERSLPFVCFVWMDYLYLKLKVSLDHNSYFTFNLTSS